MKKVLGLLLSVGLVLGLILSCGFAYAADEEKMFTIVVVTDVGGLGDLSFNDAGWLGAQMAVEEIGVLKARAKLIQSYEMADYIPNLKKAAEEGNIVVLMGFLMVDALIEVAPKFPNTPFVHVDGIEYKIPNIASFVYKSEEGAFLAGILASAMSKTGVVGAVGGMAIPPVQVYEAGYVSGIKTGNKLFERDVKYISSYTGSFDDPAKGNAAAKSLIGMKADVVFQIAGRTGLGVLKACQEEGVWGIGVDQDQDWVYEGNVLTSVLKKLQNNIRDSAVDAYNNKFKGGYWIVGVAEGAIDLSDMNYTRDKIPTKVLEIITRAKDLLRQKKFVVPATLEEAEKFILPGDLLSYLKG